MLFCLVGNIGSLGKCCSSMLICFSGSIGFLKKLLVLFSMFGLGSLWWWIVIMVLVMFIVFGSFMFCVCSFLWMLV